MRVVLALVVGLVSGVGVAFPLAIVLAVLNLYLAGRGVTWPNEAFDWWFFHTSFLNLLLVVCSSLTFLVVFVLILMTKRPDGEGVRRQGESPRR